MKRHNGNLHSMDKAGSARHREIPLSRVNHPERYSGQRCTTRSRGTEAFDPLMISHQNERTVSLTNLLIDERQGKVGIVDWHCL